MIFTGRLRTAPRVLILIISLLCVCAALSGCASGLSADGMMKPPKAAGDGGEIQLAMNEQLGDQITLRFPANGEYRTAVVRADVDNDGLDEAIAFYRTSTENSGAHMVVLDKDEKGAWQVIGEENGGGGEIERVMFGDLNGDGTDDIVTGWSFYSGATCVITASTYDGGRIKSIPVYQLTGDGQSTALYTEMVTGDFDRDGVDEIMSVYINKQTAQSVVSMFKYQDTKTSECHMASAYYTELDGSAVQYISAKAGNITETIYGLVLDGYLADGSYCTELVYWNQSTTQLVAPLDSAEGKTALFRRKLRTISEDINEDGIIELPRDELLPCYSDSDTDAIYLTIWDCYLSGSSTQELSAMLMRKDQGYYIIFRDKWRGRVTARVENTRSGGNVLYLYDVTSENTFGNEIMRIKVFSPSEWEEENASQPEDTYDIWQYANTENASQPRYRMLRSGDYYIYAVLISGVYSDPEEYPQFSPENVLNAFRLQQDSING